jgi:serine/threonine protein kinase
MKLCFIVLSPIDSHRVTQSVGFLTEARAIAHLRHPHIVQILDFGIEGTTPFLVMDYAPNGNLRQQYPKGTLIPLDTCSAARPPRAVTNCASRYSLE